MRLIVCGGRRFTDHALLHRVLNRLRPEAIAEGGHRYRHSDGSIDWTVSADALAFDWARLAGVPCETYDADWSQYGLAAGPRRNTRMLDEFQPSGVVAFDGGRGTNDMVSQATWRQVAVLHASGSTCQPHYWFEDFFHENGRYLNHCSRCARHFVGHKRRIICWECVHA